MNTRSTSSLLYRRRVTPGTSGNASSTQILHLLLCPRLEKHENKDHEGQTAEFTEGRVLVAVPALEREWDILDENSSTVDDGCHDSKLETDLEEGQPLWLGLVQFWCIIVNKSGNEERKYETSDTNPRDAQGPDEGMLVHYLC
jgi:hypothetical protein